MAKRYPTQAWLLLGATLSATLALACQPVRDDVQDALDVADDGDDDGEDVDGDDDGDGDGDGDGQARDFSAVLTGANERPVPVPTSMSGNAAVSIAEDGNSAGYAVDVTNGDDVIAAHIHVGSPEEAGPIVVTLFASMDDPVDIEDGELASGSFDETDLEGPMEGGTLEDLIAEMEAGNTYVNVHTVQYPDGEIRGQLDEE